MEKYQSDNKAIKNHHNISFPSFSKKELLISPFKQPMIWKKWKTSSWEPHGLSTGTTSHKQKNTKNPRKRVKASLRLWAISIVIRDNKWQKASFCGEIYFWTWLIRILKEKKICSLVPRIWWCYPIKNQG